MSDNEIIVGNLTTIIMFVFSACGGGAIIDALGGTSQTAIFIGAVIGLAYAFVNAYFPNHFSWLNNNKKDISDIADTLSKCNCSEEE